MNKYIQDLVYNILNEGLFDDPDLEYDSDIINQITSDKINQIHQKIDDIISGKLNKASAIRFMSDPDNIGVYSVSNDNIKDIIKNCIKYYGNDINLNWLDVSQVTDMSELFAESEFNGDISKWDVSSVTDMSDIFTCSTFNSDISKWDVSSVVDMSYMFFYSEFNGDISNWDVSSVTDMSRMFQGSKFNGDISNWDVCSVTNMSYMFWRSEFNGDISNWDVRSETNIEDMFYYSPLQNQIEKQPKFNNKK